MILKSACASQIIAGRISLMHIELYRESEPTKMGFRSRCPKLGLTAHGRSPEIADKNLERLISLFFAPLIREGVLDKEFTRLGLTLVGEGEGIQVLLTP